MKYRIKAYHYKKSSKYCPERKYLWYWMPLKDEIFKENVEFTSKIKAQKFLEDYVDKANAKIENIPYEI